MRSFIKFLGSFLLMFLAAGMIACGGGGGGSNPGGGTGGGTSGDNSLLTTLSGTIANWNDKSKADSTYFVVAVITHEDEVTEEDIFDSTCSTEGTIASDGSFSITLNTPAATYLTLSSTFEKLEGCTITPATLNGTWNYEVEFFVYETGSTPGTDAEECSIEYTDNYSKGASLMYSDVKGTIDGIVSDSSSWNETDTDDIDDDADTTETVTFIEDETTTLDNLTLYAGWNWLVFSFVVTEDVNTSDMTVTYTYTNDLTTSTNASLTGLSFYIYVDDEEGK